MSDTVQSSPADTVIARQIANIAFFFCFFPSLFYFIMPAQTQPIAAMLALPLLFLYPLRITAITLPFLVLIGVIISYTIATLFIYPEISALIIVNGGAYISPLVLFLAFQDKLRLLSPKPLMVSLWIWAAAGSVQAFPFPGFVKSSAEFIGRAMMERFIAGQYSGGGRGYSLLASEPSASAPTIAFMALSLVFFYREGKLSVPKAALGFALVAFMTALNRSGSLALLYVLILAGSMLGSYLKTSGIKRMTILVCSISATVGVGVLLLELQIRNIRAAVVFTQIIRYLNSAEKTDIITLGVMLGAQRIIPVVLGYGSLTHNFGVGHGIASWSIPAVIYEIQKFVGIDFFDYYKYIGQEISVQTQTKPQSYLSLVAFDTGFVGLVPLVWALAAVFFYKGKLISRFGDNRLIYLIMPCVWLALFTLSTLPAPWVLLAYSLHIARSAPNRQKWPVRIVWRQRNLQADARA